MVAVVAAASSTSCHSVYFGLWVLRGQFGVFLTDTHVNVYFSASIRPFTVLLLRFGLFSVFSGFLRVFSAISYHQLASSQSMQERGKIALIASDGSNSK